MNKLGRRLMLAVMLLAMAPLAALAQTYSDAIGAPGPIAFDGKSYALSWAAQPAKGYFKQEYLPEGQNPDLYTDMFLIDALARGVTAQDAATAQIRGLIQRRATDPALDFSVVRNALSGEIILDFTVSDISGPTTILEWNAYRYVPMGDGFMVLATSRRAYGDAIAGFVDGLKRDKASIVAALTTMDLPKLTPQQ